MTACVLALWACALLAFRGWEPVRSAFGMRDAQVFFYVMQGALGALSALCIALVIDRPLRDWQRAAIFAWVVYVATEQVLIALCGASWYWSNGVRADAAGALCDSDHGWEWPVIVLCSCVLLAHFMRGNRENRP